MPQIPMPRPAARVVDAVKRRVFERGLRSITVERADLEHVGSDWGGWDIPAGVIDETSICYCVGAGGDLSFDIELLRRGATVRSIDPFYIFRDQALEQAGGNPRFSFHLVALAAADGLVTMYGRQDEKSGVVSTENIYRTQESYTRPGRTLTSLMREVGDERIDLLKLDIEGSEYSVLESIDPSALGIRVLCVEFHHTSRAARARAIIDRLRPDYAVVHRSGRSDLTLARR